MTAVRIAGAVFIIAAAVLYGRERILHERKKLDDLCAVCELVEFVRDNISVFSKALPQIYTEYAARGEKNRRIADYFIKIGDDAKELCLGKNEAVAVDEFRREVGKKYRDEAIKLCDYTLLLLKKGLEECRGEIKNKEKLYRTIPLMLAVSVVLILL